MRHGGVCEACDACDGEVKESIVCTASMSATMGSDKFIDYTMSKHAVLGLVRSVSKQLGA